MHSHSGQWRGDRQCFARLAACGIRPEPPRRAHRPLQTRCASRAYRCPEHSKVKFVHNVRPPVPGIRLRGRFSIQIAPHGPGGAASDIGISEPLGEDGDRDAAWPLGPDPRTQGNDSRVPSARDACGSDAEALPQGSDRRFRHLNSCAPSGRRQILPK
jgi:hypothetical protein